MAIVTTKVYAFAILTIMDQCAKRIVRRQLASRPTFRSLSAARMATATGTAALPSASAITVSLAPIAIRCAHLLTMFANSCALYV